MIRISDKRLWTALIIIALAGYAGQQSFSVLSFALNEAEAIEADAVQRLTPYVDLTATAARARRDIIDRARAEDPREGAEELASYLSVQPLASDGWLQLSRARLSAGEAPQAIVASLALATLTGPNESYLMARRAIFAMPLWSALPPDSRRSLISDLVSGGFDAMDLDGRAVARFALATATQRTRDELNAGLLLMGKKGAKIATSLSLTESSDRAKSITGASHAVQETAESRAAPKIVLPADALTPTLTIPSTAFTPGSNR